MVSATGKLYIRGLFSNGLGFGILYGVTRIAEGALVPYVVIAMAVQASVFLLHGLPTRSEKFYDLSGSATHFLVVASSLLREAKVRSPRQVCLALASVVWMTRLGTFLFVRINRDGKDERFDEISPVWLSFMGAWTLQSAWVTLTQLPVVLANELLGDGVAEAPLSAFDFACAAWWLLGFAVEFVADLQKFTFRGKPENRGKYITEGLWGLCRHPNYFGEISMWVAAAAAVFRCADFSSPAGGYYPPLKWAWLSPGFTAFLLLCVSGVPLVEKAGMEKWGGDPRYVAYVKGTSCLVPWFNSRAEALAAAEAEEAADTKGGAAAVSSSQKKKTEKAA